MGLIVVLEAEVGRNYILDLILNMHCIKALSAYCQGDSSYYEKKKLPLKSLSVSN